MSYLKLLPKDIFNIIFTYLDSYDIINLCIEQNMELSVNGLKLIRTELDYILPECFNCGIKNIKNIKSFMGKKYLCLDCVGECYHCSNYIHSGKFEKLQNYINGEKQYVYIKKSNREKEFIPGFSAYCGDEHGNPICGNCASIKYDPYMGVDVISCIWCDSEDS